MQESKFCSGKGQTYQLIDIWMQKLGLRCYYNVKESKIFTILKFSGWRNIITLRIIRIIAIGIGWERDKIIRIEVRIIKPRKRKWKIGNEGNEGNKIEKIDTFTKVGR